VGFNHAFFNKSATSFFLNKINTGWDINEIICFCKRTFDAIIYKTFLKRNVKRAGKNVASIAVPIGLPM